MIFPFVKNKSKNKVCSKEH